MPLLELSHATKNRTRKMHQSEPRDIQVMKQCRALTLREQQTVSLQNWRIDGLLHVLAGGAQENIGTVNVRNEQVHNNVPRRANKRHTIASHLSAHPGAAQTKHNVSKYLYWPGVELHLRVIIRVCFKSNHFKSRCSDRLQQQQPHEPLKTVALELMGPCPRTWNVKRCMWNWQNT
ncbi:hypothetical protein PR048_018663 [Dryococelus australis]|uniref:Integrase zinc-binding domain-containing protein n=1 Tax=Dryococelus australis TaxID=614101 RepID=A0ABQ9HD64_9NEOP|nr:hypothetical protein PR048_018663 [Dryococelus australis]